MDTNTEVTDFILMDLTNTPKLQIPLFIVFTPHLLHQCLGEPGDDHTDPTGLPLPLSRVLFPHLCNCGTLPLILSGPRPLHSSVKPLHPTTTMTISVCALLAMGCYICSLLNASIQVGNTFSLSFSVMALSCSDKHISKVVLVYVSSFNVFFALLIIILSYLFIFITSLKMQSAQGHQKALSTCTSHLTTVSIFYGTVIFTYLQPSSSHSMDTDKTASMFYTVLIPMLNPVVYSLRNKEVKNPFKKVLEKVKSSLILGF
ncbi:olfactory receptor 5b2-like [Lynx pardinus]|uniref:Olfactory receptor 5b2-like n=1 Tax=Lynx pardinus TaxID=191816 RepID=A0A485MQS9_LYNPA|nr:olfactory receptor 5b2-like [Lynx pardinus]